MSVNESERGKGKFDVLIKANGLAVYTIRITKNPKIFLPEYQTALTNDIIHTAKEIFTKAWTANNIRVGDEPRNWLERKKLQQEAARECNNLLALIQIAKPLYHLTSKRVKYWGTKDHRSTPSVARLERGRHKEVRKTRIDSNAARRYYKRVVG